MKLVLIEYIIIQKLCLIFGDGLIEPEDIICPPNQEVGCSNYCLEKTCGNIFYNGEPPRMCPLYCETGCVCKFGYVLANDGSRNCVKIAQCPKICCPVNRVYKRCGPLEPRTCDNRELVICNDKHNCNEGCFCSDGLVEDGFGNCIPEENCPTRCAENELEDPCMNPNQPTCTHPNPVACGSYTCHRGCVCKPPYIRNEATGQCVDRNSCVPPTCPNNEVYKESGFDCWTCSNYMVVRCALITTPQCFCKDDYVHHDVTGQCIPKSQCPQPVCGENEIYAVGPDCQTCSNYAVVLCLPTAEKRCICKSGYYRHDVTGVCTLAEDCPVCPGNETYTNYGDRDCQTCENWQTVDCFLKDTPDCYCSEGYVHQDSSTRDCIAIEDCPKPTDCPDNEHYSESGYDCLTCQDIAAGILKKCALNPEGNCYCDSGFNRDVESGECRPYDDCKDDGIFNED